MLPAFWLFVRAYAPIVMLPFSVTVGFVGYKLEWFINKDVDQAKDKPSILSARQERLLNEIVNNESTEKSININQKPKTIFDNK